MNVHEDHEHVPIREAAIIKLQKRDEVEQANHEYESTRQPAKIIVTTEKNDEVQHNALPF
jgi:hypothetical protein